MAPCQMSTLSVALLAASCSFQAEGELCDSCLMRRPPEIITLEIIPNLVYRPMITPVRKETQVELVDAVHEPFQTL